MMSEIEGEDVMDVGLIAAAQAVEHYEITRYGALVAWATELGRTDCCRSSRRTSPRRRRRIKSHRMAERRVNPKAEGKPARISPRAPRGAASRSRALTGRQGQADGAKKARRRA